ncbi:MAG: hypothetical protein E7258_00065 [Lachnospiraceae bacterium]|nr:hypothetical protein [Lachnospiraceae bacterium]
MKKSRIRILLVLAFMLSMIVSIPVCAAEAGDVEVLAETTDGWVENSDGTWSYYISGSKVINKVIKIGNDYYGFDGNGRMYEECTFSIWNSTTYQNDCYRADANGVLYNDGWYQDQNLNWFYYYDNAICVNGWLNLGSSKYYINQWSGMFIDSIATIEGATYHFSRDGVATELKEKAWTQVGSDWYYIFEGNDIPYNQIREIGGNLYYFDWTGKLYSDGLTGQYINNLSSYETICADANGVLARNKWVKQINQGRDMWYYFGNDGVALKGMHTIAGKKYFFNTSMMTDGVYYYNGKQYLINAAGEVITGKSGWYKYSGRWYYIYEDGSLYEGLLNINGTKYYMQPDMMCNSNFIIEGGVLYQAKDTSGVLTPITKDGWYEDGVRTYYIKNGAPYVGWVQSGNSWYYVDPVMCISGVYQIDGEFYKFDSTGKMYANTWIVCGDTYYYATASGAFAKGEYKVGNVTYQFDDYGYLIEGNVTSGATLVVSTDTGSKKYSLKEGWNQIGTDYYYVFNGNILVNTTMTIGGFTYGFDIDGKMYTNRVAHGRYFDGNGAAKTGWIQYDGSWLYAREDGQLCSWSLYLIDGIEYYFTSYRMSTKDVIYNNDIILKINSSGVVTDKVAFNPNGWNYVDYTPIYFKDGERYTGWLGNSYIRDGRKIYTEVIYDQTYEAFYYIEKGSCVYGRWCGPDNFFYAKSNGKLAFHEWVQLGGVWYYFDEYWAVTGAQYIDGVNYYFDDYGRLKNTYTSLSNGWYSVDGKWLYARDGRFVKESTLYVGGVWYYMDGKGAMKNYYDYQSNGYERPMGWHCLDGKWYYANLEGEFVWGWHTIGGVEYYFDAAMFTGYHAFGNELHYFDASGAHKGKVGIQNGWYSAGGEWYYFIDGELQVQTNLLIGGLRYAFDYEGRMITNMTTYVDEGYMYFGSNGVQVKKAGIYTDKNGEQVYVSPDGYAHIDYIYLNGSIVYMTGDALWSAHRY